MSNETTNDSSGTDADEAGFRQILDGLRGNAATRRGAIDALYTMFGPRIRQFMRSVTDPAEAEDLNNDVFVNIMRGVAKFRGDGRQLPGWIWTIARRIRLDWLRGRQRQDFVDDEVVHVLERVEDDSVDANPILGSCVQKAFEGFARKHPDNAQCLTLVVRDGLSNQEIAGVLGRSEHAARQYLFQCRKKLWQLIGPCFERPPLTER